MRALGHGQQDPVWLVQEGRKFVRGYYVSHRISGRAREPGQRLLRETQPPPSQATSVRTSLPLCSSQSAQVLSQDVSVDSQSLLSLEHLSPHPLRVKSAWHLLP